MTCTRVWLLAVAACGGLACNAHISKFEATQRHVCPGTPVDITWVVTGSAKLTASPPTAEVPNGPVASTGHVKFIPKATTRVSLRVTRCFGEPTGADVDIDFPAPVRIAADLNDTPVCEGDVLTLTTQVKGFDPGVMSEVVGLENSEKRSLDISRLGPAGTRIKGHVAPGVTTGAFAALSVNGEWKLSSPLMPGESCTNPPHVLTAYTYTGCKGGSR